MQVFIISFFFNTIADDNQLVGEIPTQLGQLSSLDKLYLGKYQFRLIHNIVSLIQAIHGLTCLTTIVCKYS
jgi:hypothetical protein